MFDPAIVNTLRGLGFLIIVVTIWDLFWKGKGLWVSAKNNEKAWFIAILILNTVGILPIIYLLFFQKKHKKS